MRLSSVSWFSAAAIVAIGVGIACSSRPLADKPSCKNGGVCPAGWGCGADDECVFVGSGGFGTGGFGAGGGGFGAGGGGVGGSAAIGGGGGIANVTLGGSCEFDYECSDAGLGCMRADSGLLDAASPAGGLCTVSCANDETKCATIASGAHCLQLPSGAAYCVEGCSFGPTGETAFSPLKCHGRAEMACSPIDGGSASGACLPRCNLDSDCESGWFCHPRDGYCHQDVPQGLAVGQVCTLPGDGGGDACRGVCDDDEIAAADGGTAIRVCTEGCTFGVTLGCGWSDISQPAPAYCLTGAEGIGVGFGPGAGDLGQCIQLCDCDGQCASPLSCLPFGASSVAQITKRQGFCGSGSSSVGACD